MSPGAQLVVQRHDVAVDLGPDAAVADVGVDGVGEVERGRAAGEVLHFALRGEDEDLVLEEVDLERLEELGRVLVALGLDQLAQPGHLLALGVAAAALLVGDVGGDPVLGQLVHFIGPDLDLERLALGTDHGRVKRLVHVGLRHRDEVLETAWERLPERVDDPDRAVAVLDRADDHPHRGQVEDLVELAALLRHLRVDRVEVLGAAGDLGLDPELAELVAEEAAGLGDVDLALVALLGDELLDLGVLARVKGGEGEVLQLPFDRVDTEPVGQRRVDLQRLARYRELLLLRQGAERAHVVEAVGQLDQDHPDVGGHRDHHLAVVLRLPLVAALEGDPGQLRDAVDQLRDLLAELLADLVEAGAGVLDRVVEQGGAEGGGVEAHAGADLGDARPGG